MRFSRMKYVIASTVFTACSSLSLASPADNTVKNDTVVIDLAD